MDWTVHRSSPGGHEIFYTHSDWPWGPTHLHEQLVLGLLPGGKVAGLLDSPATPSSREFKERVELQNTGTVL